MTMQVVRIERQDRQSLVMKATPDGLVVFIPDWLDTDSRRVRAFVEAGLEKLPQRGTPLPPAEELTQGELCSLVTAWAERVGVTVSRVQIRAMRSKWASCSDQGTLTLAADLLRLPRELIDYVLCHELVHLKIPAHGKGFQVLMGCLMPDWRERERRLMSWVIKTGKEASSGT